METLSPLDYSVHQLTHVNNFKYFFSHAFFPGIFTVAFDNKTKDVIPASFNLSALDLVL